MIIHKTESSQSDVVDLSFPYEIDPSSKLAFFCRDDAGVGGTTIFNR